MSHYRRLWESRLDVLRTCGRGRARRVRIPREESVEEQATDGQLYVLVELRRDTSLFDHAALQVQLTTLLQRRVQVVADRGLRPETRERLADRFVPF